MKLKGIICLCLCFVFPSLLEAQQVQPDGKLKFNSFPVAPTPNAAALGKFTEIPVSKSTGIPQISIPIYNYVDQNNDLSLAISISYHAGGHKVEDMASNVGLGWSLNAGGVISRSMNGLPDETFQVGYLNTPAINKQYNTDGFDGTKSGLDTNYVYGPKYGIRLGNTSPAEFDSVARYAGVFYPYDTKADVFTVSCGGLSTKFFFDKTGKIIYSGLQNLKISFTIVNNSINSFTIIDNKGSKYIFDQTDIIYSEQILNPPSISNAPIFVSSWYLSRIEAYDGVNKIYFEYTRLGLGNDQAYLSNFTKSWVTEFRDPITTIQSQDANVTRSLEGTPNISKITLPDSTIIEFSYGLNRLDFIRDKALTEIIIANKGTSKKYKLNYDYFETDVYSPATGGTPPWDINLGSSINPIYNDNYKRLKLTSIQEVGTDGQLEKPYEFGYFQRKLPVRNSKQQDWWGYYSTTTQSVPVVNSGFYNYPPANSNYLTGGTLTRNPNELDCKAWVLNRINYPTGGSTFFEFELHDATLSGFNNTLLIGGLRVKNVKTFSGYKDDFEVVNYEYKTATGETSGKLLMQPIYNAFKTNTAVYMFINQITIVEYLFEHLAPTQTLAMSGGAPVMYERVTETRYNNLGNSGKTVYEFMIPSTMNNGDATHPYIERQLYEWTVGLPTKTTYFNNNNLPIKQTEAEYNILNDELIPLILGMPTTPERDKRRNLSTCIYSETGSFYPGTNKIGRLFGVREYFLSAGRANLKKETIREFDSTGTTLITVKEYYYNNQYDLISKIVNTVNGRQLENRYYYPSDYTTGINFKSTLINANRVNTLISTESWQLKNNQYSILGAQVFDFSTYNGILRESSAHRSRISTPQSETIFGGFNPAQLFRNSSYESEGSVTKYDSKGRINEVIKPGGEKVSFIWGIGTLYPVASVNNAEYNEIAFTSFEPEESITGFEGINSSMVSSGGGVTGERFYQSNTSSINISKYNLLANTEYYVTYWTKSNPLSVSGSISGYTILLSTVIINGNVWKHWQHKITGLVSTNISGTGSVDELRVYPVNSQMSTITMNPLLGVTTTCDNTGKIVYYKYDNFNRLKTIKDSDGNLVKVFEYKSNLNNSTVYVNDEMTVYVSKNDCPVNYTSSPVPFTVPAGKFASVIPGEVYQKALGYINSNAQDFANIHGICVYSCPNCFSESQRCINQVCETGIKIYTASVFNASTNMFECTYHYEFSDGYWSQDYTELSAFECLIF